MASLSLHFAVVGAGLGGLAAAISLRRAGHAVTILEQAPALGEVGAGIQIPPNCCRILRRWGIIDQIEAVSTRPRNVRVISYNDGRILSNQNLEPYTSDNFGEPYLHIHRADYHKILVNEATRIGVAILLNKSVHKVDFEAPAVHLRDGTTFTADIVVGADGLKSVCREQLLGRPDPPHLTGDLAYRIIVPATEMMKHEELRELAATPNISMWFGPNGHVVGYLLASGRYNLVLACPDNLPELVNTAKADLAEMHTIFKDWDPKLRKVLEMVPETSKWRLQNSKEMSNWSHPSGKFVLLGDACHATLPYIAQGAAMAIEDGAILGDLFAHLSYPAQIPELLRLYETERKPRATRIVEKSTWARGIYHIVDGPEQEARNELLRSGVGGMDFPNPWADRQFREWLWRYDSGSVADRVYKQWARETGARL